MTDKRLYYLNRFEFKYIIDIQTRNQIIKEISQFCNLDRHTPEEGEYCVTSLYYDNRNFDCYFQKLNGEKHRRKIRIRHYNRNENDYCFIEIKGKISSNVYKKRIRVPIHIGKELMSMVNVENQYFKNLEASDKSIINEIWYQKEINSLSPVSTVSYKRRAYTSKYDTRLRITFDALIKARKTELTNIYNNKGVYILDPKKTVMEVKYNEYFPSWILNVLNKHNLVSEKVPKYCLSIEKLYKKGGI